MNKDINFFCRHNQLEVKFSDKLFFRVEVDLTSGCIRLVSSSDGPDAQHLEDWKLEDSMFREGLDRSGHRTKIKSNMPATEFLEMARGLADVFDIKIPSGGKLGTYWGQACYYMPKGRKIVIARGDERIRISEEDASAVKPCAMEHLSFGPRGEVIFPVRKAIALITTHAQMIQTICDMPENMKSLYGRYNTLYFLLTALGFKKTRYREETYY